MRGVRDELPHPLLGPSGAALGLGPGPEGRLDLAEHRVQRAAEPAQLGTRFAVATLELRYPPGQVAVGDRGRGALDLAQRPQAGPYHRHADRREQHQCAAAQQQF